ncbi:MAG: acyltransferase [Pseudomonadota bacterium]
MSRSFSLYLDVLRLGAAVMVLLAHWAFPRFTGEDHLWMRYHDLGGDGVVIFFVLSGMLITYAAENRRSEGAAMFAADRLSRLWSVAVPALGFCFVLDMIGQAASPALYAPVGYEGGISVQELAAGATFTNQIWFFSSQPGSNGPYWSLGYEAWYYAIFAGFFFAPRQWRYWVAGGLALIAGPKIWLLAPSWIMGVFVWRCMASGRLSDVSRPAALALTFAPVVIYFFAHTGSLHWILKAETQAILGADGMAMIGPSDTFAWSAVLGLLTSLHILGAAALFAGTAAREQASRFEPAIRWLAGGSFALYLIHFPVMHFAGALLPGDVHAAWRQGLLLALPCIIAYAFAEISERRRPALRNALRALVQRSRLRPARRAQGA